MSTKGSTLMDKVPIKLRIRIYKLVLRADHPLLIANKDYPDEIRFGVTFFTVSKQIYAESFDIFFEVNAIRLWRKSELDYGVQHRLRCLDFVRHLELINIKDKSQWLPTDGDELAGIIDTCLAFPRIRTLTIAYDGLKSRLVPYLESQKLSDGLRCVDVGRFQLEAGAREKVHFKHYGMVKAWQNVQARASLKMKARFLKYNEERHGLKLDHFLSPWDLEDFMSMADLPLWCHSYNNWRAVTRRQCDESGHKRWDERMRAEAFKRKLLPGSMVPWVHADLKDKMRLEDLDVGKHGAELAQWLSELLCEHSNRFSSAITLD
ncbi:hypothetical protein LTR36_010833 [Oleoguttula mirabilis]|uniref:Uncharacterized protein n=1 Tax=Oleoguttula mirabilis TaxID=1507867 RepID=A0AAV9J3P7_9PEZI|nr:hypothetical protein LTR36_010833 [Oleoguttula mirabilis]